MQWSLIAALLLLVVLAAITLAGVMLPREHRVQRAAEFRQSPDSIWAVISDVPAMPEWMPGLRRVSPAPAAPDAPPRWTFATREGDITMEIVELDEPRRMTTRIVEDGLAFGGTWTYEIAPHNAGSRLTITEDGWISNPLFRFFARYVFGLNRTTDDALRAIGGRLGEEVTPGAARLQ